ncbi:MAG: hypothetical protein E3J73_02925 [Candidatus Bathyarchaeum sp.]|nr:MAG: hypothetical protein E3J73_02925 [Candidatus Bathyarchaeum sp.]
MPLTQAVSFKAVIQKNRRIHIPVVIRWRFKLEPGEVFKMHLKLGHHFEDFYCRMGTDGRLTVPKVTAKEFLKSEEESLEGSRVEVTLYPVKKEEEIE